MALLNRLSLDLGERLGDRERKREGVSERRYRYKEKGKDGSKGRRRTDRNRIIQKQTNRQKERPPTDLTSQKTNGFSNCPYRSRTSMIFRDSDKVSPPPPSYSGTVYCSTQYKVHHTQHAA